jgi:flagellin
MSDITLSSAVRSNLLSLQGTADLLARTQERLATGKEVNSALDNPTNFFTASALNSRANDLSRLLDGVSNATQTLEAADNGIEAITNLVESAQATARQALQTAGTIDSVAAALGTTAFAANDTAATVTGSVNLGTDVQATTTGNVDLGVDVAAEATGASGLTGSNGAATIFASGESVTITVGSNSETFDFFDSGVAGYSGSNVGIDIATGVDIDTALGAIQTGLRSATSGDETVALAGGSTDTITINAGSDTTSSITIADSTAGSDFGGNQTVEPTNAAIAALDGQNLTIGSDTITFGTGSGQVTNRAEFESELASLTTTDVTASINGSNFLSIAATNGASFAVGGTVDASTAFGITEQTYSASNTAIGALSGTLTVGSNTLTFGAGNIETRADLETELAGLGGDISGSINGSGFLSFTADDNDTSFAVGGTLDASTAFGITEQDYDPSNTALAGLSGTLEITVGTGTAQSIDLSTVNNIQDLDTELGNITGVTAERDTDGNISITSPDAETGFTIGGTDVTALGLTAGAQASTSVVNPERTEFVDQYNELLSQIDELAEDASFNGVNLLDGDSLSVIFNEDGSSTLDITGVNFDATGLGLTQLASNGLDTDAGINTVLNSLDSATSSLRSQASEFGSNLSIVETRENFTKSMINTLETGAAELTLADTNEEGANLLALQTRQQLSSTALSLASQADQNVLRLF